MDMDMDMDMEKEMEKEKEKSYDNIRNAWQVQFRFPKDKHLPNREWMVECSFPAVDIVEYDNQKMRPSDGSFDIGQGRAHVHANWLIERHGSDRIETCVRFVGVQPWWVTKDEDPEREFTLKAKYDSRPVNN
jgi:hypothetical protein